MIPYRRLRRAPGLLLSRGARAYWIPAFFVGRRRDRWFTYLVAFHPTRGPATRSSGIAGAGACCINRNQVPLFGWSAHAIHRRHRTGLLEGYHARSDGGNLALFLLITRTGVANIVAGESGELADLATKLAGPAKVTIAVACCECHQPGRCLCCFVLSLTAVCSGALTAGS